MKLVFWQNIVSILQVPFLSSLSKIENLEITLVVSEILDNARTELGWEVFIEKLPFHLVLKPDNRKVISLLKEPKAKHFFSGINSSKINKYALSNAIKVQADISLISESVDLRGIRGVLRFLSSFHKDRVYRHKFNHVFCIGKEAKDWYRKCGYRDVILKDFCYSVDPRIGPTEIVNEQHFKEVHFVFVGSLIHRKGVDVLLKSLSLINNHFDWKLFLIGDGPDRLKLEKLSEKLGIGNRVVFSGVIKNEDLSRELISKDIFILPSRRDGWGAVINESLHHGLYSICSDACGAQELVYNSFRGNVFQSESIVSLKIIIEKIIPIVSQGKIDRISISKWAISAISPSVIAKYFYNIILDNGYIKTPWIDK